MSHRSYHFVLQNNHTSCLQREKYEYVTECFITLIVTIACFCVGFLGVLLNAYTLFCYGLFRKLSLGSDKLTFIYGIVDILGCLFTLMAFFAIFETYTSFSCISYMVMFTLMTRTAVYMFMFISVNRYFSVCLRDDDIHFFSYKRPKVVLFGLLALSAFETVLHCYAGCIEYNSPRVLFLQYIGNNYDSVWIHISYGLTVVNYLVLIMAAIMTPILYFKISKAEKQNHAFAFGDPKYDALYQKKGILLQRYFIGL